MIAQLHIRARSTSTPHARLHVGHLVFPCLIGKFGMTARKREGDGKSPVGTWRIVDRFFRADRVQRIQAGRVLKLQDGWCDDPKHRQYNQRVKRPFSASHEVLCREDNAYDIVITTNHNAHPRVKGGGSAIFFHLIAEGATCTAGCVAVSEKDMRKILSLCSKQFSLTFDNLALHQK